MDLSMRYQVALLMTIASVRYSQQACCATNNLVSIFFKNERHKNLRPFYRRPIYFQYYAYFFKNSTLLNFKNTVLLKSFFKRFREKPLLIYWGSAVCVLFGIGIFFIHQKKQPSGSLLLICSNGKKEKSEQEKAVREKAVREKAAREKSEQEKAVREKAAREKSEQEKAVREKSEQEKTAREKSEQEKIMQLVLDCSSKHPGYIWALFSTDVEFIKDICQWSFESNTEEENNKKHAHLIKNLVFQEPDVHSDTVEMRWKFWEEAPAPINKLLHPTFLDYNASIQIRKLRNNFFSIEKHCFRDFNLLLLLGERLSRHSNIEGEFFYKTLIEKTDEQKRTIRNIYKGEEYLGKYLIQSALKWPAGFCLKALISHSPVVETIKILPAVHDSFINQIKNYQEQHKINLSLYELELRKNPPGEEAEIYTQKIDTLQGGLTACQNFLFIL